MQEGPLNITARRSERLHHHHQRNPHSRMPQVKQEILAVDVVDIAIIVVVPVRWPRVYQHKRVSAIEEARPIFHRDRPTHLEGVAPAELRSEFIVRNMRALPVRSRLPFGASLSLIRLHRLARAVLFWTRLRLL